MEILIELQDKVSLQVKLNRTAKAFKAAEAELSKVDLNLVLVRKQPDYMIAGPSAKVYVPHALFETNKVRLEKIKSAISKHFNDHKIIYLLMV